MKVLKLKKSDINDLVDVLTGFGKVYAPVQKGERSHVFQEIQSADKVDLDYNRTILPPKKYFHRPVEPMFSFSPEDGYTPVEEGTDERFVVFGVHACDIHGLKILDMAFGGTYVDEAYMARRKNAIIVGMDCTPDEHCFCYSMGTNFVDDGFDLFLSDIGDSYIVRVATSTGDDITLAKPEIFSDVTEEDKRKYKSAALQKAEMFKTKIDMLGLPEIMDMEYESKLWEEVGGQCLSCGTCSMVCPTCYCYDVVDELNLDGKTGVRKRQWDSCLAREYSLVAGGHNFAADRSTRMKKRYYHKLRVFSDEFGRPACVGCGRCSDMCVAELRFGDTITKLRSALQSTDGN
jgi:sulfhydrogenase subunit beta (sulfur reductase)